MKRIFLAILALTIHFTATAQQQTLPEIMPQWELFTEDGARVSASDFSGKPLILHFWATWCPYCKELQPGLDQLSKTYSSQGLEILAVSLSEKSGATPQQELESRGLNLKTVVNGDELGLNQFMIAGTPTTVFIAPDGKILGATMQSNPNDPQWKTVADYLISLPRK